jgi:serpin B
MRKLLSWLTGKRNAPTEQGPTAGEAEAPAKGNTKFALDLYLRLKDCVGLYENVVCSPFAVSLALATVHAGARGQTEGDLARVLQRTAADGPWPAALAELRAKLIAVATKEEFVLGLANGLWAPAGPPFIKEFCDAVARAYGADVKQADFSQEDPARNLMNQWLGDATRHMLDAAIARSELTQDARLVSITALCFKGYWAQSFGARQTLDEPFWVNPHTKIVAPMMWHRGAFPYRQFPFHFADRVQVLELPYAGEEFAMVLLLPEGIEGIIELEHTLGRQKGKLDGWLSGLHCQEVEAALPKFAFRSRFNLGDSLGELTLGNACAKDEADFTGMRPEGTLFLSHMLHQALVAIDEYGSDGDQAGGGSKTSRTIGKAPRIVPLFRADHPFLFVIRDRGTGQILLIGRVMNPPVAPKFIPVL